MNRREFLARLAAAGAVAALPAAFADWASHPSPMHARRSGSPRTVILGMDGLDPVLLKQYADEGALPHFKSLMAKGDFKPLRTIMPPQSPVAWSSFITGTDPGGHGIFDFVHRDPLTYSPQLSLAGATPSRWPIQVGGYSIPLVSGKPRQMRQGTAFWEVLDRAGISSVIYQIPANFPPAGKHVRSLSGMGTPDIRGTSGTFSFFSDQLTEKDRTIAGADIKQVSIHNHRIESTLVGPPNSLKPNEEGEAPHCEIPFTVDLDPTEEVAKFAVQDAEFILKRGEWSDWVELKFDLMPHLASATAIARFYLQEVRPRFRLYVTPLQINPADPAMPISTPADYAADMQRELGYFYTQELPADTKAWREGIFNGQEFLEQSQFVFAEQRRAFDYFMDHYAEGPDLLFFYFSSVDQGSHMFWCYSDATHVAHQQDPLLSGALRKLYIEMDEALGRVQQVMGPEDTLIIMSDHGFAPFNQGVNLNTWLFENGYVRLRFPNKRQYKYFENCDWKRTKAYALGLNGLYVNLEGREGKGIVKAGKEYDRMVARLRQDLLGMRDEAGNPVISQVVVPKQDFRGPYAGNGPDLIVGYARGYRSSWKSPLGEFPEAIFENNMEPWSGDHCMDSRHVPGVLLSNRKISINDPSLYDLTVAVLNLFGQKPLPEMIGRNCLA